jgi:preprotein translocase subunit SecA
MAKSKLLKELGSIKKQNTDILLLLNTTDLLEIKKNIHSIYEYFKQEQIKINGASKEVVIAVIDYIKDSKIKEELIQNYQVILGKAFKDFRINYEKQNDLNWQIKDYAKTTFLNIKQNNELIVLHNIFTNINNWLISNHTKLQEVKLVKEKLESSFKFVNLMEPWFASLEFKSLGESYQGNLLKEIFESISSTNNLDKLIEEESLYQLEKNNLLELKQIKSLSNPELIPLTNLNDKSPTKNDSAVREILKKLKCREEEKQLLLEKYNCVKNCEDNFVLWGKKEIQNWSEAVRGKLTNNDVPLLIAIMDRANKLVTASPDFPEGHSLRDIQIFSLLSLLNADDIQLGRLAQIATGEGKSTIVSMLAIIKVLQGQSVDIITSSPILAERDAKAKAAFYNMFKLTVSHNKTPEDFQGGEKACYKSDIVYGSVGNFQADYLRDEYHGKQTLAGRIRQTVIVDEVDSMLIDSGGHMVKLSSPIAGMEYLDILLFKIWHLLNDYEQKGLEDKEIKLDFSLMSKLQHEERFEYIQVLIAKNYQQVKTRIKEEITNIINERLIPASDLHPQVKLLLPQHLEEYALNKIDVWIDSAIHAKYTYQENKEYILKVSDKEEDKTELTIVPVDYVNTGGLQKNMVWENGLHPFLELKHNLKMTTPSLTTCFISNIGYFKLYNKLYGLTGTLGAKAEQDLLRESYNIDYVWIPTFKDKKFTELQPVYIKDNDWLKLIIQDSVEKIEKGRAVLIICETIQDACIIEKALNNKLKGNTFLHHTSLYYLDTDELPEANKVKPGDIIIATNIAGRGTDITTTIEVEHNGGLHVCLTFLPANLRVEEQAFGRTSRQGNEGSGQMIVKLKKTVKFLVNNSSNSTKDEINKVIEKYSTKLTAQLNIKDWRDSIESERLEQVRQDLLLIDIKDAIFRKYKDLYKKLREEHKKDIDYPVYQIKLKALEEEWGKWLIKFELRSSLLKQSLKLEKSKEVIEEYANECFNEFRDTYLSKGEFTYEIKDEVISSPYYFNQIGEYYNSSSNYTKAKMVYDIAIKKDPIVNYFAEQQLSLILIHEAKLYENILAEFLKNELPFLKHTTFEERIFLYKEISYHLQKAQEGLTKYMEELLYMLNNSSYLLNKHIESKLLLLTLCQLNLTNQLIIVESIVKSGEDANLIIYRCNDFTKDNLVKEEVIPKGLLTVINEMGLCFYKQDIAALKLLGINNLVLLKKFFSKEIKEEEMEYAKAAINNGMILFNCGASMLCNSFAKTIGNEIIKKSVTDIAKIECELASIVTNTHKILLKSVNEQIKVSLLPIEDTLKSSTTLSKALRICQQLTDQVIYMIGDVGFIKEHFAVLNDEYNHKTALLSIIKKEKTGNDLLLKIKESVNELEAETTTKLFTKMMLEREHNILLWRKAEAKIHKIVTNSLQLEFSKDEDKEMINLVTDLIKLPLQEENSEKLVEQIVIETSNDKSKYLKPIISKPNTIPIKESIIECVKEFCSNIDNKEVRHTLTNIKTINKLSDFISQNILTTIYDKLVKIISHYGTLPLISKIIGYLSYSPDTGDIEDYDKLISKEDGLQLQSYNNILDFFSEVELEIDYEQKLTGEND